jgi:N utilization substance protein B
MKRRRAREYALQALFQYEFTGKEPDLRSFWEGKREEKEVVRFSNSIIMGTIRHMPEIDAVIRQTAEHWVIERMAAVDRNILRAAVYELLYARDIPPAVAINEALEIAKKYSTSEAASFINGILDRVHKRRQENP